MRDTLSLLFGLRRRVGRGAYFKAGISLMAMKYVIDALLILIFADIVWTPIDYLTPLLNMRGEKIDEFPVGLSIALVIWTIPFIWIGVGMTLRRAVDAGLSPWLCLLFFLPILNYVVMLGLSLIPSSQDVNWNESKVATTEAGQLRSGFIGAVIGVGLAAISFYLGVFVFRRYGNNIFMITPFLVGLTIAYIYNRGHPRDLVDTLFVVFLSIIVAFGSLLLFALEGILCLAMAFPLVAGTTFIGALIGRAVAVRAGPVQGGLAPCLLLIPAALSFDLAEPERGIAEISTSIEIDAAPERVWDELIAFDEIKGQPELIFRMGIAYPVRARIEGRGVGAIRYCEFSTGPFVEPITVWDAPRRLAFDVTDQPAALQEWSPYRRVYAQHSDGYFRSARGEFRLVELPGSRTRLEGSTWYTLKIYPQAYWGTISDLLLRRIHLRVLEQIKLQAESEA